MANVQKRVTIQEAQEDPMLFDKFIEENLPLVYSVVRRFHSPAEREDNFQCGCIGLVKAAKDFNQEFGTRFSTYAVPRIEGEIRRYRRDYGTGLKVSRQIRELSNKIYYYRYKDFSDEEICRQLNITTEELREADAACLCIYSLNKPISENDKGEPKTLEDTLSSDQSLEDDVIERAVITDTLNTLKSLLSKEYYEVFVLYLKGKSQTEIGKIMGVSQVQISRTLVSIKELCKRINTDYDVGKKTHTNNLGKFQPRKMREVVKMEDIKFTRSVAEELLRGGESPEHIAIRFACQFSGSTKVPKSLMAKWGLVEKKAKKDGAKNPRKKKETGKVGTVSLKAEVLSGKEFKYELGEGLKITKGDDKLSCEDLGRLIQELQEIQRMQQVG